MERIRQTLQEFAKYTAQQLRSTEQFPAGTDTLAKLFADDLARIDTSRLEANPRIAKPVRGLSWLPTVHFPPIEDASADAARAAMGSVIWSEYYQEDAWSRRFLDRFAVSFGIGPSGTLISEELVLGLFMLGPNS
ncbi:MAG: hypothetical protein AAGH82_11515, partial [Pseudomonadota bacterium]